MSSLMAMLLAAGSWSGDVPCNSLAVPAPFFLEDGTLPSPTKERLVLRKDGGPGHGPEMPYSVREQGATDLEGFVGGKYIFFVGPWDVIVLALIVVLVVVLIIVL